MDRYWCTIASSKSKLLDTQDQILFRLTRMFTLKKINCIPLFQMLENVFSFYYTELEDPRVSLEALNLPFPTWAGVCISSRDSWWAFCPQLSHLSCWLTSDSNTCAAEAGQRKPPQAPLAKLLSLPKPCIAPSSFSLGISRADLHYVSQAF